MSNKLKSSERMFADNSLRVNPTKTDVTLIRCRQRRLNKDLCVNFEGATIHPSTSVKVLGMAVDCNLTWVSHVSLVVRRCYAIISGLSKMSHRLSFDVKMFLVEAPVFPHILYLLSDCMCIWRMRVNTPTPSAKGHEPLCSHGIRFQKEGPCLTSPKAA